MFNVTSIKDRSVISAQDGIICVFKHNKVYIKSNVTALRSCPFYLFYLFSNNSQFHFTTPVKLLHASRVGVEPKGKAFDLLIDVPSIICGHEFWLVPERMR